MTNLKWNGYPALHLDMMARWDKKLDRKRPQRIALLAPGDTDMTRKPTDRAPRLTERGEQEIFAAWLRDVAPLRWPKSCMADGTFPFFAVPNGGSRGGKTIKGKWVPLEAINMKRGGVRSGVPDVCIPVTMWSKREPAEMMLAGLWIEMKIKGGRVAPQQTAWLEYLYGQHYVAVVCYSYREAIVAVESYMEGRV